MKTIRLEHGWSKSASLSNIKRRSQHIAWSFLPILTFLSCGSHVESVKRANVSAAPVVLSKSHPSDIVVVLTIDGVRWQEIFRGSDPLLGRNLGPEFAVWQSPEALTPHLHQLASRQGILFGADTAPMVASSPSTVSLPGYSEIFSGRSPSCANNDCPATTEMTFLDEWTQRDPSAELTILSSWSRIGRAAAKDLSRMTVSAGRSVNVHAERFCVESGLCLQYHASTHASPWPGDDDYRPDRATSALAIEYLRVHQPQFIFVGLGDTDEHAHHGDYRGYLQALHAADATVGAVSQWLRQKEQQGHRTLFVCTTDHGRSHGFNHHGGAPEAARVWALFSGSVVAARGQIVANTARLADIAPTVRTFIDLRRDTQPAAGQSLFAKLNTQVYPTNEPVALASGHALH